VISQTITLQYYPRQVFLNSLHPLTKFLGLIVVSFVLFFNTDTILFHVLFFCLGIFLLKISGYSLLKIQGGRIIIASTIFIALIQLAFINEGEVIFSIGSIQVTDQAFMLAVTVSLRFITIILFSYLFVLSTEPNSFVLALVQLGMPYRFGFAIITAIKMVPAVKSEFTRIIFAQLSRGVTYKLFPVRQFFQTIKQFLNVLIIAMIKRVNSLEVSMEGRSFGLYKTRTFIKEISYSAVDLLIIICELLLIPIIIFEG
jgi:energy-coupling factor transport system permease protein